LPAPFFCIVVGKKRHCRPPTKYLKICASVLSSSVCSSRFSDEKTTNELVAKATTTNEKTTNELVAKATTTNDNYYERKDYERISC